MTILTFISPFLFSLAIGYLTILQIFAKEKPLAFPLNLFLGAGLGLGTSAVLSFNSFLILNSFQPGFILAEHILILFFLCLRTLPQLKKKITSGTWDWNSIWPLLALVIAMIPAWIEANFYPHGGWDAWQVWNYKAKFLFLAGNDWRNMFEPFLWRASPHYPLMLPLINIWGWNFQPTVFPGTPLLTALLFTFLTAGLLYSGLKNITRNPFTILAPLLFLSLPFYLTLATSQYCDIVVSYYLLAALFCLIKTLHEHSPSYALLSGAFLGFLCFTKPEGVIAAMLISGISLFLLLTNRAFNTKDRIKIGTRFMVALGVAGLAAGIFQFFLSPGNQTFINGLSSAEKPASLYRLKIIPVFLLVELISSKWNGLWIVVVLGGLLQARRLFRREIVLLPLFLAGYMAVVLFYYYVNTYFKIEWWLQVTLNRILFSLLPVALFWIFSPLKKKPQDFNLPRPQQFTNTKS